MRDAIASFRLSNSKQHDARCATTVTRVGAEIIGRMSDYSEVRARRAVGAECRSCVFLYRAYCLGTVMRPALTAAEKHTLLRSLAERWDHQRQGKNKQEQDA